jgi:hypothetical protein
MAHSQTESHDSRKRIPNGSLTTPTWLLPAREDLRARESRSGKQPGLASKFRCLTGYISVAYFGRQFKGRLSEIADSDRPINHCSPSRLRGIIVPFQRL